jgi:hypothetical protein
MSKLLTLIPEDSLRLRDHDECGTPFVHREFHRCFQSPIGFSMTFRFWLCLVLLPGGIAIGDAFLGPSGRGSVILSDALPAAAQPTRMPDYSGQALRLSAGKISDAINRAANGPKTTPILQTPPKIHAAELPIAAWASETTFVAPVENPPSPSVPAIDSVNRMTLGGPIMVPVGVMEEDGDRPLSRVIAVTPVGVSQAPAVTHTSLRTTPLPESTRGQESRNLFVHPLGF